MCVHACARATLYMGLIAQHRERRVLLQTVLQISGSVSAVCVCVHSMDTPFDKHTFTIVVLFLQDYQGSDGSS